MKPKQVCLSPNNDAKNMLLLMPTFFWYINLIPGAFQKKGYSVYCYSDRFSDRTLAKSLIRIDRSLCKFDTKRYIDQIANDLKKISVDVVLIIEGQSFTRNDIIHLRKCFPKAYFVYLVWDSLTNPTFGYCLKFVDLFDKAYSFSKIDVQNHPEFTFLPDFYNESHANSTVPDHYDFDFCYIGTAHPKKHEDICLMSKELTANGLKGFVYEYLPSKSFYFYQHLKGQFKNSKPQDFRYKKLDGDEVESYLFHSKYILDSQSNDSGLTMRTFDCLASNKKIITTNKAILSYDFYNPCNIYYAEGGHIDIHDAFFSTPYQKVPEEIVKRYSLSNWCDQLLKKD
jgi:hypothetical protein